MVEVAHVRDTARRIAALLSLGPDLDQNYATVTADLSPWPPGVGAPFDPEPGRCG